jgi:hypothetical protein
MDSTRRTARRASLIASALASVLSTGAGALEVKIFSIGDFVPSASGGCGGGDRSHWPAMVDEWYDEMGRRGHIKDGDYRNGSMTIQRFCDPDWTSGCNDHNYWDEGDAVMIGTHGADAGDHWVGTMRSSWNGHCGLDAGGTSDDMWAGDMDAEFLHFSSCNSADDDNLSGIRHAMHDPEDGGFAHGWFGFHGVMYIDESFDDDYADAAAEGHSVSIASAWVTNHYHNNSINCEGYDPFNWFGTCEDQCPVGYAISSSESGALSRVNYERYNNVYSEPTGNNWYAWMGYEGCHPVNDDPFDP